MPAGTIRSAVKRFLAVRRVRGRKEGWRKTTPAEDAKILAAFRKVRKPLGSLVEKNDVWKALPAKCFPCATSAPGREGCSRGVSKNRGTHAG